MSRIHYDRRRFLLHAGVTGAAVIASPVSLIPSAFAQTALAASETMRGGSNNYSPDAPLVDNLGTGFLIHGRVRQAGAGEPLANVRIQIWAATLLGGEREPRNHGSVMTDANGNYRLEMTQIVPNFGQPHAHLAYDDSDYKTVFLRPVMPSKDDTSLEVDFVLARA